MYYCSIEDAWGNNYFNYKDKISNNLIKSNSNSQLETNPQIDSYSNYYSIQKLNKQQEKPQLELNNIESTEMESTEMK